VRDIVIHQAGNAEELARVVEGHLAGALVDTRGFEQREQPYRLMSAADLWSALVSRIEQLGEISQAAAKDLSPGAGLRTGRTMKVPWFAEHMREKLVRTAGTWSARQDRRGGAGGAVDDRAHRARSGRALLERGCADLDLGATGRVEGRLRVPGTDDVVVVASPEDNSIDLATPDGPATVQSDAAARVLLLWGRRPADPSRWRTRWGPRPSGSCALFSAATESQHHALAGSRPSPPELAAWRAGCEGDVGIDHSRPHERARARAGSAGAEEGSDGSDVVGPCSVGHNSQDRVACVLAHRPGDERAALLLGCSERLELVANTRCRSVADFKQGTDAACQRVCQVGQALPSPHPRPSVIGAQGAGQGQLDVPRQSAVLHGSHSISDLGRCQHPRPAPPAIGGDSWMMSAVEGAMAGTCRVLLISGSLRTRSTHTTVSPPPARSHPAVLRLSCTGGSLICLTSTPIMTSTHFAPAVADLRHQISSRRSGPLDAEYAGALPGWFKNPLDPDHRR